MGRPKKTTTDAPLISATEAESITDDLEKLKEMAGAGEMAEAGYSATAQIDEICVDKESIRRKIAILSHQLETHKSQRETNPAKRRELEARRKTLESKFVDYLETYRDLGVIRRESAEWSPAYKKATKRHEVEPYISEWKRIGLRLEPQDPDINSLERLRKDS